MLPQHPCERCQRPMMLFESELIYLPYRENKSLFLCKECQKEFDNWLHEYEDDDEPPRFLTAEEIEIRDRILSISYPAQTEITADSDGLKIKVQLKNKKEPG